MSLQVCHCGWSKVTTYQGLRIHQGRMGCTPKGMNIPQSQQLSYAPKFSYEPTPIKLQNPTVNIPKPPVKSESNYFSEHPGSSLQVCHCGWSNVTTYQGLRIHQGKMGCTPKGIKIPESELYLWKNSKQNKPIIKTPVKKETPPRSPKLGNQINPKQASVPPIFKPSVKSEQQPLQMPNLDENFTAPDYTYGAQTNFRLQSPVFTTHINTPTTQTPAQDSFFETPTAFNENIQTSSEKARRMLDFSAGTRKVKQDKKRADLQQKIYKTEQKMSEIRSSVKACKNHLDAEWIDINSVFFEVIKVVQDARQKALEPVEKRRQEVKSEAHDLLDELQKEVDRLKDLMDELDENPDLQVSCLPDLDYFTQWDDASIDTSFSFGTLRATTTTMMKEIQQILEELSSIELNRIPAFAVDVKLDFDTAHPCLIVSDDGKEVRDGGMTQELPDSPERFDVFESVLGNNIITSGRSYWEVEVGNKTGWDLGVSRRRATRKGIIPLNTYNGYWVAMHSEEKTYAALTVPPISLSLKQKPQKVGVFVDYEVGLVSFYDVTNQSHIYSFTECSFTDEIVPYFSPHFNQNGKNSDPLIISAVQQC